MDSPYILLSSAFYLVRSIPLKRIPICFLLVSKSFSNIHHAFPFLLSDLITFMPNTCPGIYLVAASLNALNMSSSFILCILHFGQSLVYFPFHSSSFSFYLQICISSRSLVCNNSHFMHHFHQQGIV